MKFEVLREAGRRMLLEEAILEKAGKKGTVVADNVRSLGMDERFGAVLALIERNREAFVQHGMSQEMAGHHGHMAHCMGSAKALDQLLGNLEGILGKGKARGGMERSAE